MRTAILLAAGFITIVSDVAFATPEIADADMQKLDISERRFVAAVSNFDNDRLGQNNRSKPL